VPGRVVTLVRSLAPMLGFNVRVSFDVLSSRCSPSPLPSSSCHHSRSSDQHRTPRAGTEASVAVSAHHGLCRLRVVDNGVGLDAGQVMIPDWG